MNANSPFPSLHDLFAALPAGQLGFGTLAGFVAGYAAKKIARLVAILLGLTFFALQLLAYEGWITIHWHEIQHQADDFWREAQQQGWFAYLWMVLTDNLPFGGAFAAGFTLGFRLG